MILVVSDWFWSYGFADVHDDVLVGAYPLDAGDVSVLEGLGVRRILNLAEDDEYEPGQRPEIESALAAAGITETRLMLVDYGPLPPEALEQAVQTVNDWLDAGERTYVHCRAGWQRSAAVAAGVVAVRDQLGIEEALELVRARKPSAKPLDHQREDLIRWWNGRGAGAGTTA
jgi:Dual specificity phosphatase, catalytic domain